MDKKTGDIRRVEKLVQKKRGRAGGPNIRSAAAVNTTSPILNTEPACLSGVRWIRPGKRCRTSRCVKTGFQLDRRTDGPFGKE